MNPRETELWRRYRGSRDAAARAALLDLYIGLVHHAARELIARAPRAIELGDLLSAGTVGLVQALEGFELEQGFAFSTYAMPRIRGAILDEMRHQDPVPRSVRDRQARLAHAAAEFERGHGRPPDADELAHALGVDLVTYRRWEESSRGRVMVALDAGLEAGREEGLCLRDVIADERQPDPAAAYDHGRLLAALHDGVESLGSRDRLVLGLSFVENLSLREIGEVLHITESRVSQIRTRALKRLREHLESMEAA